MTLEQVQYICRQCIHFTYRLTHILFYADMQHISERNAKRRYQEILKQKELRGLIEEQEKHLGILQAEAERLRSKTFPVL